MIELDIRWDGSAPGLAEHRPSIDSFAEPMRLLLVAVRSTANNMIKASADQKQSGAGRRLALADQIDLQIVSLKAGSTMPSFVITIPPPVDGQASLWPEQLAED